MNKFMALSAVLLLAGCPTDDGETGETGDTDVIDTDDTDVAAMSLSAEVTSTGAVLTITNGVAGDWFFGLTQAGTSDDWTGEDCLNGYTVSGTTYQWCHPATEAGVTLTRITSTAWNDIVAEMDGDATKTLFHSGLEGTVGFYVEDPQGNCYVDGEADAIAQWSSLGCAAFP